MSTDLTAFLTARMLEDEVRARAVAHPARLLREAEAKRRIVGRCTARMNELDPNGLVSPRALLARQILIDVAAAYSDFPGYRQEWAP